jgi:adenylate cyclase
LQLLDICLPEIISKTRYIVLFKGHTFEIDVFEGKNNGLTLCEIELNEVNEYFEKPNWLGKEVTGDKRYYNSYLSEHPFP